MKMIILILIWFMLSLSKTRSEDLDLILFGIFPLHGRGNQTDPCGKKELQRGFQRELAMKYAVQSLNNNTSILKNVLIKDEYIDSCDQRNIAVEKLVQRVLNKRENLLLCDVDILSDQTLQSKKRAVIGGVIGAATSSVSIEVANLLRLFKIPQISYASTSELLNDKIRYEFFTRSVPPDTYQVNALIDILKTFNWNSFSVIYSEGNYGEDGFDALNMMANKNKLCIVHQRKVVKNTDFQSLVQELRASSGSKLIVLFCTLEHTVSLLQNIKNEDQFTFLASEVWGNKTNFLKTKQLLDVANGTISLKLETSKLDYRFLNFLEDRLSLPQTDLDDKLGYVIDAVYALASALNLVYLERCPLQDGLCSNMTSSLGEAVMRELQNLTYNSLSSTRKLNENGSANSAYDILYLQSDKFVKIGSWEKGSINLSSINNLASIKSLCSQQCKKGEVKRDIPNLPNCCNKCFRCQKNQYVDHEGGKCRFCPKNSTLNEAQDGCKKRQNRYLLPEHVKLVVVASGIGVIVTLFVILMFIYHLNTDIVRLSAPELTFPLLTGVMMCYCLPFIIVADQNKILCGIRRFGIGFSLCICYSAIFTKTNRLSRVFNNKSAKREPRFLSVISQLIIFFIIITFELGLALAGLLKEFPKVTPFIGTNESVILTICYVPQYDVILTVAYNLTLVVICTVYAFRTRKVPTCFNEAKYLGFVMYTTLLIWLAFLPLYVIKKVEEDTYIIGLCFTIFLSATSILIVLFGPKIYALVIHPEARKRRSTSMRSFSSLSHSMDYDWKRQWPLCKRNDRELNLQQCTPG